MEESRGLSLFKKKSFRTRLITGIILGILLAATFILGYTVMLCVLGLLSVGGIWEFLNAKKIIYTPFAVTAFVADILYYILIYFYDRPYITLYMIFLFVMFAIADIIIFLLKYPKYQLNDLFASFFSVFYVGITLSFLYLTRVHPWGAYLVWLSIFSSWGCDVFAYMGGMLYGKKRIFPEISPKKTLEGCVTGVIGAGFLAFIYALCVQGYIKDIKGEAIIFPLVCIVGAVIGMFGDLFASAIKRSEGIKDYSNLLPGHGGILDRFDSVIVVSPIIYLITILIRLVN